MSDLPVRDEEARLREIAPESILAVRSGHGANCSSIGSVVDTLFATATVGAAIFVAVAAALRTEEVRVIASPATPPDDGEPDASREVP